MYERGDIVSDTEDVFLSHLPPDTPVFQYNPQCDLQSLMPPVSPHDCFVVIKAFPSKALDELDEQLPGRLDYSLSLQTLILKMPCHPHEEAASRFEYLLMRLAEQMMATRRISCLGATRIDGEDRKKQADRAWSPIRQGHRFPTVALEVEYSQTAEKLQRDIAWWLLESKGRMRMGITINIKRGSGNIEIKSWVPAMSFPQHASTASQVAQRILMKRGGNGQEPTIQGGDLIIPFQYLFLNEPREGEGDFVFTQDMLLHDIAELIWATIDEGNA
jgi:hypothetical protein